MNVIVTDFSIQPLDVEDAILRPLGCVLTSLQCRDEVRLKSALADADYVITQFAPITAAVIATLTRCRAIVRYGTGVDNVDLEAAARRGIPVCNVPDFCTEEVADHALAMILNLSRQLDVIVAHVRKGAWDLPVPREQMRVLKEMTVGIVGFGRIGRAVSRRLAGFGGRVLAYDPMLAHETIAQAGAAPATLEEIFRASDVITLHCPSSEQTRGLIDRASLAKMKRGVLLVNVARGDLIHAGDLIDALESGHVAGAALDVTNPEPIAPDSALLRMPNVLITCHVASVSERAVPALRTSVAETVAAAIRGEPLRNVVNGVRGTHG